MKLIKCAHRSFYPNRLVNRMCKGVWCRYSRSLIEVAGTSLTMDVTYAHMRGNEMQRTFLLHIREIKDGDNPTCCTNDRSLSPGRDH
jgi:hypothetical protein